MKKNKLSDMSLCKDCELHEYKNGIHSCVAFPPFPPYNGIPEIYLTGAEKHLNPIEGQFTSGATYTRKLFTL